MSGIPLKSARFRTEREESWRELETLVDKAEREGLKKLDADELGRLPMLYRGALSSLAVARAISLDLNVLLYLEGLAGRAYLCVYGVRRDLKSLLAVFLRATFPKTVRRLRWHIALAYLFLALGTATGFILTLADPDRYFVLVPEAMQQGRTPFSSTESLRAVLFAKDADLSSFLATFAALLFTHNAKVGMLAFCLGFAAGLPVFYLLFTNGVALGALAAVYHTHGLSAAFWGWILPHGVTELTAVALCGGAGLVLAQGLLFPGRHHRLQNLALQGRSAGLLVLGAVFMFFIAGLIEGIFRQVVQDTGSRYLMAGLTLSFWTAYFLRAGRGASA